MDDMVLPSPDQIRDQVRIRLTQKTEMVMNSLTPYINGDMGDISPGHVQVFLAAAKIQGQLHRVFDKPDDDRIPADQVARMVEEARAAGAAEGADAVLAQIREARALEAADSRDRLIRELARIRGVQDGLG